MFEPVALPDVAPHRRRDPEATRHRWEQRIERFRSVGRTVAALCAAEGVSVPAFYTWRRQLAAEAAGQADPPALIPVRVSVAAPAPMGLVLPGGAVRRSAAVVRQIGVAGC